MTRTTMPVSSFQNSGVRTKMIRNAMACNNCLTENYLRFKKNEILLCFCHPEDRPRFETELGLRTSRD